MYPVYYMCVSSLKAEFECTENDFTFLLCVHECFCHMPYQAWFISWFLAFKESCTFAHIKMGVKPGRDVIDLWDSSSWFINGY